MIESSYFEKLSDDDIKCTLCPHYCILVNEERGKCGVRKNLSGKLITENYGVLSAIHLDPVEKKPLYHYYPGSSILSIGSVGCNLNCSFCQNCDISQTTVDDYPWLTHYTIDQVLSFDNDTDNNIGIAYTYNEPTVYFEFMMDLAREAKKRQLKNVMVSNGFIAMEPLAEIIEMIDAFNIDIKSFQNKFYKQYTGARVKPIQNVVKKIRESGKHLEITNLIIPTVNDDVKEFENLLKWILDNLGSETVLHLSRYFPAYKLTIPATPEDLLIKLYNIAIKYLPYTYIGNIDLETGQNTICPSCSALLVERKSGYKTHIKSLDSRGHCVSCGLQVIKHI